MDLHRPRRAVRRRHRSGVYTTDSAEQLRYLVNDSDSRFLFVENDEQLDKFLSVRDDCPALRRSSSSTATGCTASPTTR